MNSDANGNFIVKKRCLSWAQISRSTHLWR